MQQLECTSPIITAVHLYSKVINHTIRTYTHTWHAVEPSISCTCIESLEKGVVKEECDNTQCTMWY